MKTNHLTLPSFALGLIVLLSACRKENEQPLTKSVNSLSQQNSCTAKQPFKGKFDTWYRVSPAEPQPIEINGVTYVGFAYFPGGGKGNATHVGLSFIYFNQLVYATAPGAPPAGSIGAPVIDAINYPVTGGPLPLIQAGDFALLAHANENLHIPSQKEGRVVNSVLYDKKGNAIFTSAITGSGGTFPISEELIGFNAEALIVGGTGKFEHATGKFGYEGYFNITNANDASYNIDGWISY